MDLDFQADGSLGLSMKGHISEAIKDFGEDMNQHVSTPSSRKLFWIDDESPKLDEELADKFHSIIGRLLWVLKRGRPEIETAMSFLCTRIKEPTQQDWAKLRRLILFLHKTIDDERIIGADNLSSLLTSVDAAYTEHGDMRSHTGGTMSMGTGILHGKSQRQKLNTKSSIEAKVVGVSKYSPYNIHFSMFMVGQGYPITTNTLLQDNESAIKMEQNGRSSCTSNSKHIHTRYFFVKDRVDKGELTIEYCLTEKMLAD